MIAPWPQTNGGDPSFVQSKSNLQALWQYLLVTSFPSCMVNVKTIMVAHLRLDVVIAYYVALRK